MKEFDVSTKKFPNTKVIVDDEDAWLLEQHRWTPTNRGARIYLKGNASFKNFLLHRVILGAKKGECVDHINGRTLDSRKSNMRLCEAKDNAKNVGMRVDSKQPYKGIQRNRHTWAAHIAVSERGVQRRIYLGNYKTPEAAARAYDAAAEKYHGAFARTNKSMGLL